MKKPFSKKQLKADTLDDPIVPYEQVEQRGQQEISKYDPEYLFLIKLIKLVVKEGVNPQEIKDLSLAHPFETIDDAGDLAAKIWTLATEKYHIPRGWLLSKLPEKMSSLKKADLWPAQEAAESMLSHTHNSLSYNPLQENDTSVSGPRPDDVDKEASPETDQELALAIGRDIIEEYFIQKGLRWSQVKTIIKKQSPNLSDEELAQLKSETQGKLAQFKIQLESKKKSLNIDKVIKLLNNTDIKVIEVDPIKGVLKLENGKTLTFDEAVHQAMELDKTGVFSGAEFSTNDVGVNPSMDSGFFSSPEDHGAKPQKAVWPNTEWLPADDENKDEEPYSNIASSLNNPFSKKAHCGPCAVIKAEVIKMLADLKYKDASVKAEDLEELAKMSADPSNSSFIQYLDKVIESLSKDHEKEIQKLKNHSLALKDIQKRIDEGDMVADKPFSKKAYTVDLWPTVIDDPMVRKHFADRRIDIEQIPLKYPIKITYMTGNDTNHNYAYYSPKTSTIYVNPKINWDSARSSIIHEIEHVFQEGMDILPKGPELAKKLRETPYGEQPWEWSAKFQQVRQLKNKGYSLEQVIKYFEDREENLSGPMAIPQEAIDQLTTLYEMVDEVDPQSVVGVLSKKELIKKANPPSRFWIAPDGKEFEVAGIHPVWIKNNPDILKHYGIVLRDPRDHQEARKQMFDKGWIRISNEPAGDGFQIELPNLQHIPSFLDNFIAKYFKPGDSILLGNGEGQYVKVNDPFPSIQKAVNKALRQPVTSSIKKADLKEYSTKATRLVNDYIVNHPQIMEQVIHASKTLENEDELYFWMKEVLGKDTEVHVINMEEPEAIQWNELAYAWFNTVKRDTPLPGDTTLDIEKLPVLDKKKKLDELLDQFSAETDPQKQEQIKQHIERIKRANLNKQASSIEQVGDTNVYINPSWEQANTIMKKSKYGVLRGIVEPSTGNLFIWPGDTLTHEAIVHNLGIDIDPYSDEESDFLSVMEEEAGLRWMFEMQQKVRKALSKKKKKADISGQMVNEILKDIELSGGITYNISKGNLSGTDNYAVSTYPDREKIVEGPVDYDTLEGYIEANQDLLKDPNNSFGAWTNNGKVYLDIVVTLPEEDKAIELARQNNQLAVWDLKNNKEITTGVVRAFSKKQINKKAEESLLSQDQQNQIAAVYCPAMVMAANNYVEAVKNGHQKERAFEYAVESVSNIDKISGKDLASVISTYLQGLI